MAIIGTSVCPPAITRAFSSAERIAQASSTSVTREYSKGAAFIPSQHGWILPRISSAPIGTSQGARLASRLGKRVTEMKVRTSVAAMFIGALFVLSGASAGIAQSGYPDHTVRIMVGFAAAGPVDILARIVGDKLAKMWGQSVVIENVPGSGGNIAGGRAAKSAPDGYTLLMSSNAPLVINPSLYSKMPYDAAKDL